MNIKKTIAQFAGACAVIALSAGIAHANLLVNPGFEEPPFAGAEEAGAGAGWTAFNNVFRVQQTVVDGVVCDPISCAGAHGGTVALKAFGASGAFQDFAASPGEEYAGSVWGINPLNADRLTAGGFGIAQIIWLDSGGGVISDVISNPINDEMEADIWTLLSVDGIAPDGTATARFQLFQDGGGAPRWDDASFDQVVIPVPAAVWLFGSGLLGLVGVARRKKS